MLMDEEIKSKAIEILSKIQGFTPSMLDGKIGNIKAECIPCLYTANNVYIMDCYERGQRFQHRTTTDEAEALFWVFYDVISALAFDFELKHRNPLEDNRRQAFEKMNELFYIIGNPYEAMWKEKLSEILNTAPYDDEIHKILYLAEGYEAEVNKLGDLPTAFSIKGKYAVNSIQNRYYRSPMGGMKNPLQSIAKMEKSIAIIRKEIKSCPPSPQKNAFESKMAEFEKIFASIRIKGR